MSCKTESGGFPVLCSLRLRICVLTAVGLACVALTRHSNRKIQHQSQVFKEDSVRAQNVYVAHPQKLSMKQSNPSCLPFELLVVNQRQIRLPVRGIMKMGLVFTTYRPSRVQVPSTHPRVRFFGGMSSHY